MAQRITRQIIQGLNFDSGQTRTAVVTYSDDATVHYRLDAYVDKRSTLDAISFLLERGRTNTAKALRSVAYNVFNSNAGDRNGVRDVVVIVTDGNSNVEHDYTIDRANSLKNNGVSMYAIGVGEHVDQGELSGIADSGKSYLVEDDRDIEKITSLILDDLCL